MQNEIGSEFWEYSLKNNISATIPDWLNWGFENRFFVSGRTALDHIIKDIKATRRFETIYMPSYCCHTVIEPFISNSIRIKFYDVIIKENGNLFFNVDYDTNCDGFIYINYFGFQSREIRNIIDHFKSKKITVIEDSTQSLFCQIPFNTISDYVFASLRKWLAVPGGGLASKINSGFIIDKKTMCHSIYLSRRLTGMNLKKNYINSPDNNNKAFLKIFDEAENLLQNDYKNYIIDDISLDIVQNIDIYSIRSKRISNATRLINCLRENKNCFPLFNKLSIGDCPLFVPIIVKNSKRDLLRNYLIGKNIYCPVHWSKSDLHKLNDKSEFIYDNELSIVCDQRYNEEDMDRIIMQIKEYN